MWVAQGRASICRDLLTRGSLGIIAEITVLIDIANMR